MEINKPTRGPAEKVKRFENKPGWASAASGRLSHRSGLPKRKWLISINSEIQDLDVLELPSIFSPHFFIQVESLDRYMYKTPFRYTDTPPFLHHDAPISLLDVHRVRSWNLIILRRDS